MVKNFDHATIVVRDLDRAKTFFALLGFREDRSLVISGDKFSRYMRVDGIEADHVTLVLPDCTPRMEIQLLRYHHPRAAEDPASGLPTRVGFNHICFAVDDLDAEVARLVGHGVRLLNEVMDFNDRRLVFLEGPEHVTVELAQWRV